VGRDGEGMSPAADSGRFRLMSPATRAVFLMRVDALKDLDPDGLAALARLSRLRYFRKGTLLYPPARPPACFQVIVRGEVETEAAEQPERLLSSGAVVGLLTLLAGSVRAPVARSRLGVLTLEIEASELFDYLESRFELAERLLAGMCRRLLDLGVVGGLPPRHERGLEVRSGADLDLLERSLHLRRSLRFGDAHADTLIEASERLVEESLPAGTALWDLGDRADDLVIVAGGEVVASSEEGEETVSGEGTLLGHLEALAGVPRRSRVVTRTPVVLLRLSTEYTLDLLEDHFGIALDAIHALAARLLFEFGPRAERRRAAGSELD
jgi:CRP-like cAMP-binding protein